MTERDASRAKFEEWLLQEHPMDGSQLMEFGRKVWDASRQHALTEAFQLLGGLHATDRAPPATIHFYDSVISEAQNAIRSLIPTKGQP